MKMSVSNLKFLFLIAVLISYTSPAYAYLDPGTGSMIIQGLIAGLAAIMFACVAFFKNSWYAFKELLTGKKANPVILEDEIEPSSVTQNKTDKNSNIE